MPRLVLCLGYGMREATGTLLAVRDQKDCGPLFGGAHDVSVGALALTCLAGSATERGAEEYRLDEIATSCTPATPVG